MEKASFFSFFRKKSVLLVGSMIGVLLLLIGTFISTSESEKKEAFSVSFYTEELEKKIKELCESVSGVSDAHVLLTLDSSGEYVYAQNTEKNISGSYASDYLIITKNGEESGVLLEEIFPRIRGVAVVCQGGDSALIRKTLTELLSAALGIPGGNIRIAGGG